MLAFRTSPWDSKENLPLDYARIFKFANFSRTKQLALAEMTADYTEEKSNQVAMPGAYVTLYVSNVPAHMLNGQHVDLPFIVHGLLKNEQKFSLMNVVLRKYSQCTAPIKNKQTLIFHVGYRRFEINPVFSQHSNGDKFKVLSSSQKRFTLFRWNDSCPMEGHLLRVITARSLILLVQCWSSDEMNTARNILLLMDLSLMLIPIELCSNVLY
jgi:hypothetical protein